MTEFTGEFQRLVIYCCVFLLLSATVIGAALSIIQCLFYPRPPASPGQPPRGYLSDLLPVPPPSPIERDVLYPRCGHAKAEQLRAKFEALHTGPFGQHGVMPSGTIETKPIALPTFERMHAGPLDPP